MNKPIILDTGPLGMIAHPKPNTEIAEWYKLVVGRGVEIIVAEVADYEVRRNFLLERLKRSVERPMNLNKN